MPDLSIYISHTNQDLATVRRLSAELVAAGFCIAVNRHTVPPGLRLVPALREAMAGAVRFLACFSARHSAPTAYDREELTLAAERLHACAAGETWLIPVKLTPCDIPAIDVGGVPLNELAAIELHADWSSAIERLLASLPTPAAREQAAPAAKAAAPPARAEFDLSIDTMQSKNVALTNVDRGQSTNARTSAQIRNITGDDLVSITNVKH